MAPAFIYRILSNVVWILPKWMRAKLWSRLASIGCPRWGDEGRAIRMPGGMYFKAGTLVRLSEGEALHFVRSKTPLPVPVVVDNFVYKGCTYLITSRMPGIPLISAYKQVTPEVEVYLRRQLSKLLEPLRAIPPPANTVCGFDGGPVRCERVAYGADPCGPWNSVADFHDELMWRADGFKEYPEEVDPKVVQDVIQRAHARDHRIVLTHNDLYPHNILIDEHWKITAIVDWEMCAWMPEYWYAFDPLIVHARIQLNHLAAPIGSLPRAVSLCSTGSPAGCSN